MKRSRRRSARMNAMHFRVLTARYFRQIFTNLGTVLPLLLEAPVLLLLFIVACKADAFTEKNVTDANTAIFLLVVMSALMGILNSYREICKEREILSREVFGGLDVTAYALSKFVVLAAFGAGQCLVLYCGAALYTDFAFAEPFAAYPLCWLALYLVNLSTTAIGLFLSALLKRSESAILPVLLIIIVCVVFSDCVLTMDGAAGYLCYITPTAWGAGVFGSYTGLNGWREGFSRELYDSPPLLSLAVLAAITLLFLSAAIACLRHAYKSKE